MDQRIDRGQATRQLILDTATRLFTERGFEAVSIEDLLQATRLSKGALYHHFTGKAAIFRAALEAVEARIAERLLLAGSQATDPFEAIRRGCAAWLRLAAEDETVRRMVLLDAPGVIGWQAWRELDEQYSLGLLRAGFAAAASLGLMPADRVELSGNVLLAVMTEMALLVARAPESPALAEACQATVERVLNSFRA